MRSEIHTWLTCRRCYAEKPANQSNAQYARLEMGVGPHGLEVHCTRHRVPIGNITPEGLARMMADGPPCEHPEHQHHHRPRPSEPEASPAPPPEPDPDAHPFSADARRHLMGAHGAGEAHVRWFLYGHAYGCGVVLRRVLTEHEGRADKYDREALFEAAADVTEHPAVAMQGFDDSAHFGWLPKLAPEEPPETEP